MKKSLNAFVLLAVLSTSMPFSATSAFAARASNQDAPISIPAAAVQASEQLVLNNPDSNKNQQTTTGPGCIKSGVAYSRKMTKSQRKELFVHGQITDCEGNIWNIKVIPGTDKSKQMTIESWKFAGRESKDLIKIETYKNATHDGMEISRGSFDFAKSSSKLLKTGIWDYIIVDGIAHDLLRDTKDVWVDAGVTVAQLHGSFAWLFGAIYAGLLKPVTLTAVNVLKAAFHITEGTIVLVGGVAGTAGGIVATVTSPVLVPAVEILTRPLLAIGSILTTGSIIPGALYVWNGTAWATSQFSSVPDKETIIGGVPFVSLENPKQPEKPKVEVTAEDFRNVIQASVSESVEHEKEAELEAKQAELRRRIEELNRQSGELYAQEEQLRRANDADPVVEAVRKLFQKEYGADVTVSADARSLSLNDAQIKELVQKYAASLNVTLTDKELQDTIAAIKSKMQQLSPKAQ